MRARSGRALQRLTFGLSHEGYRYNRCGGAPHLGGAWILRSEQKPSGSVPDWRGLVFYELYVRAYRDSNGDGHGDLAGVVDKLDYLSWLGVDVIWLLPIYPSPLRDDGYDVADFYGVHPQYGELADLQHLLDAAHARGMKVITDLVLNHTSDQHPWFEESRSSRDNPKADWYVWSDDPNRYAGTRIIFVDTEESNWKLDPQRGQYYWHRFFHHQPDLNYDNPEVRAEMKRVVRYWLDLGFDGFRLDALPYLFERDGTNNENLPETHEFLKELRAYVDGFAPDALLLGEVNQWPKETAEYFGDGDELKLLFHFPLMPRLFLALAEGKREPIESILARTPQPPAGTDWVVFLRNHDELTLEMVDDRERELLWDHYAPDPRMRLNLGIRRRLAPLLGGNRPRIELLTALLFTLPGAPIIYYGDEIGMGDDVTLPDRDGVRTPMQWTADAGAGFSRNRELYAPLVTSGEYGYGGVNVAQQRDDPDSLLHFVRNLITIRKGSEVLSRGKLDVLPAASPAVLALRHVDTNLVHPGSSPQRGDVRTPGRMQLSLYNLSADEVTVEPELLAELGGHATLLTSSTEFIPKLQSGQPLRLPPFSFAWLGSQGLG